MPEVSVVIPTYNRSGMIREAIDSVLNQTYSNIRVIIVDDGSTDGTTPAIVDDCARGKTRVTALHQSNKGLSTARNAGAALAQDADFLLFLQGKTKQLLSHLIQCFS